MANDAHNRASIRYNQRRDNIMIRPTKQDGQRIRTAAAAAGQSVQAYILQAVDARMQQDGSSPGTGTAAEDA